MPEELKQERQARLMERQAAISARRLHNKIGRSLSVLVDAIDAEGVAIARSAADAPEIDGLVYIGDGAHLPVGEFATVRVVDADEHDLYAESAAPPRRQRRPGRNPAWRRTRT